MTGHIANDLLMHESKPRTWADAEKLLLESYPKAELPSIKEFFTLRVSATRKAVRGESRAILELIEKRFSTRLKRRKRR